MKWQAILLLAVVWNLTFILDQFIFQGEVRPYWIPDENYRIGLLFPIFIFFIFILSIAIWRIHLLQKMILRPEVNPKDIKPLLYITSIVSGAILIVLAFAYLKYGF